MQHPEYPAATQDPALKEIDHEIIVDRHDMNSLEHAIKEKVMAYTLAGMTRDYMPLRLYIGSELHGVPN